MKSLDTVIFHLIRAKTAFRHLIAFCGLVTMLLTASCGPQSSGSKTKPTPLADEQIEIPEDGHSEIERQHEHEEKTSKEETVPAVETKPEVKVIPAGDTAQIRNEQAADETILSKNSPSPITSASEYSRANIEVSVKEELPSAADRINASYLWAMKPTFVDSYKDSNGQEHTHFLVSPGSSQELTNILAKMRDDLVVRNSTKNHLQFEIKEQGVCDYSDGKRDNGSNAPLCVSMDEIKNSNEKPEESLRPLIMREFAYQHGADEKLAQQVEQYYKLPAVKNLNYIDSIKGTFARLRSGLNYLKSIRTIGTQEHICETITRYIKQAEILRDNVNRLGFVPDTDAEGQPRVLLAENLKSMKSFCENSSGDRETLRQQIEQATKLYDQIAQEFSKNSGVIILDFSMHLWPF
ncbi:hypothetical protein [Bdellovibrio sp. HCB2-146]|uniref:hypothetical protein n=1 Tax=Bdellovibrio sp. HCB2-146 TaxID=3394362 RepID=UPI0039BCC837